jgi:hypothetical protein
MRGSACCIASLSLYSILVLKLVFCLFIVVPKSIAVMYEPDDETLIAAAATPSRIGNISQYSFNLLISCQQIPTRHSRLQSQQKCKVQKFLDLESFSYSSWDGNIGCDSNILDK